MASRLLLLLLCAPALTGLTLRGVSRPSTLPTPGQDVRSVPLFPTPDFAQDRVYEVDHVVDGDTIVVSAPEGSITVRLIGVDAPEAAGDVAAAGASRFLENLLKGEAVQLGDEHSSPEHDKFGRRLCYVYRAPDGLFVNAEIVRQGYGFAYTQFPFKYQDEFQALERRARAAPKGMWDTGRPEEVGSARAKTAAKEIPAPVTVYITKTGEKYHRAGCRYLAKSSIPISLADAVRRYGPCSVCGPPR